MYTNCLPVKNGPVFNIIAIDQMVLGDEYSSLGTILIVLRDQLRCIVQQIGQLTRK